MNRRQFVQVVGSVAGAQAAGTARGTGLCLNEDNSHWFFTRAGQTYTKESVAAFVDQYAETQVRELVLSASSQRTSFASKVWDPIWKGYDPDGPDDQPLFRSTTGEGRVSARKWVHTAWSLAQQGIDPYAVWIERARMRGLSPWVSMRMNDLHNVDDPDSYMHSTFWRQNPQFRRLPWRTVDWRDRAFDFAHEEVRAYHFRLVEEYLERYDVDGLELDWMRFGFHFSPGQEAAGSKLLTEFMRQTRRLADSWAKRRGHKIGLGARVPSRPQTAIDLGMDGALWAREGLIDLLVFTPFWASIETDMPVELWRRLAGDRVTLAAGLELLLRPYHAYRPIQMNSIETVRGAAASLLERGADRVYLFNYMDSQTQMPDSEHYPELLRACGRLETLAGKGRRHVVTYSDTSAPGEPAAAQLPQTLTAGQWAAFRVHCGPALRRAKVRMEVEAGTVGVVRANGQECRAAGAETGLKPGPERGFVCWEIPDGAAGRVVIDVQARVGGTIHWIEIAGA
ncbi:hypothetical protein [uncultured Paludibaculum sp.]|uniref:hypothetical protein n=1 Tax=uncultured Paludibaculum sp. TaxID=1765020 RepID=UPI002AABFDEB|nr:hypothetical protein [uncultured Paludibaculum sp.]